MERLDSDSSIVDLPDVSRYTKGNMKRRSFETTTANAFQKSSRYLNRIFRFNQMDFQFACWQMIYLFLNPKKVFNNFQYRKRTKNQFARDDPAFLVLLSGWTIISASGLSIVLHLHFTGYLKFLLWIVFVDCILVGCLVASLFWVVTNRYFKRKNTTNEDVEWGYAFDVHLNAFFPPLLILHVFQLFLYNILINSDYFFARLIGNSLFMIAVVYYCYISFLGYSTLPFLHNTQVILYPLVLFFLYFLVATISGQNICRSIMDFYHYRVY